MEHKLISKAALIGVALVAMSSGASAIAGTSVCRVTQNNCTSVAWSQCDGADSSQVPNSLLEIDRLADLGYKVLNESWFSYSGNGNNCDVGVTLLEKQ